MAPASLPYGVDHVAWDGADVSIEWMREMNGVLIRARINALQNGPLTEEGSAALNELWVPFLVYEHSSSCCSLPVFATGSSGN